MPSAAFLNLDTNRHQQTPIDTNFTNSHELKRIGTDKQGLSMPPNNLQKLIHPSEFPSWEGCRGGFPVAYEIV